MSDQQTAATPPAPRETLMPEREIGPRRYVVVITEYAECIVHEQGWIEVGKNTNGQPITDYKTIAKRKNREREIFRGEFVGRPRISDLAKLMEGEQP